MARDNSKTGDEVQIRQLIDCWACAIRDKNIEAAMSHYAGDILLSDLAPPLVHRGVDAHKKRTRRVGVPPMTAVGRHTRTASRVSHVRFRPVQTWSASPLVKLRNSA